MPDWADTEASNLVEKFTIMQGDRVVALKGLIEAAIASKLRLAKVAGVLDALHEVQHAAGRRS